MSASARKRSPAPHGVVELTATELDAMRTYSTSTPTGARPGVSWKRDMRFGLGRPHDWAVGIVTDRRLGDGFEIEWKDVVVVDEWALVGRLIQFPMCKELGLPCRERERLPSGEFYGPPRWEAPKWVAELVSELVHWRWAPTGHRNLVAQVLPGMHRALEAAHRLGGTDAALALLEKACIQASRTKEQHGQDSIRR